MVLKLLNIPINRIDFVKILGVVKGIAKCNGYDDNIISKLVQN